MVAPIIAMAGKKASDGAGKALTGDIYTRRWTSTRGKGKKKQDIEHELKVNPLSVGIGLLAVGGAALLAGVAVWATQRNVEATPGKDMVRIVESFDATYKTVTKTVVEQEAYTTTYPIETPIYEEVCVMWDVIEGRRVCVEYDKVQVGVTVTYGTTTVPAVTHEETTTVIDKPGYTQVYSGSGIPLFKYEGTPDHEKTLIRREKSRGFVFAEEFKVEGARRYWRFHTDTGKTYGIGERTGLFA